MARDDSNDAATGKRSTYFISRNEQELPEGDNRHRVNTSSKLYIAN